ARDAAPAAITRGLQALKTSFLRRGLRSSGRSQISSTSRLRMYQPYPPKRTGGQQTSWILFMNMMAAMLKSKVVEKS
ncbi:MAG: hypothetical protein MUF59_09885, partial [Candidatus Krumholzibacteria bacterium]|nr:hypothetical protein [Candidatus Krumholzibacteria bacterium]